MGRACCLSASLVFGLAAAVGASRERVYGVHMALQYYGPPADHATYERVAAAARRLAAAGSVLYVNVCADHNDHGGGAEKRKPDPGDGGRIVPICDLGDAEAAAVRRGLATLRAAGARILHYTHTRISYRPDGSEYPCCECCEDLAYVRARIENETARWGSLGDGVFVDNVIATGSWLQYYSALSSAARAHEAGAFVGLNQNCAHGLNHVERCSAQCTFYGHTSAMCSDCINERCSKMDARYLDLADVHLLSEGIVGDPTWTDFETKLPFELTDGASNPNPQEIVELLPCKEWAQYGAPSEPAAAGGDAWMRPRSWDINVGAMGNALYFSGAEEPRGGLPRRKWIGFAIGPEPQAGSTAGSSMEWSLSEFDLLEPDATRDL